MFRFIVNCGLLFIMKVCVGLIHKSSLDLAWFLKSCCVVLFTEHSLGIKFLATDCEADVC